MKKIGFMFAGQGAQFVGMGKDLCATSQAAKEVFQRADELLGKSISTLCFEGPLETLTLSTNCQPAIYTMSIACLAAFQEKTGITPLITGGLSLGEYAALTAAGCIDFATGLQLIQHRGNFMNDACRNSNGAMSAILRGDTAVIEEIARQCDIDVANYNCPGQIVISGDHDKVKQAEQLLAEKKYRIFPLTVDGAFHSRLMQPAAERFEQILKNAKIENPQCPVTQNVVGGIVTNPEEIRCNLATQIAGSVRWESCVQAMIQHGAEALIEFGPGKVLSGFSAKINKTIPVYSVGTAADLQATIEAIQNH